MKRIRQKGEDLEEMLKELKIGDMPIFDSLTNYEISKVPNGFLYQHEYSGVVFVPDFAKENKMAEKKETVKSEEKKTMTEKKIEKPAKKIVQK